MPRPRLKNKVVSLRGAAVPLPQRNQDVIDALRELLKQAEDGHICGLLYGAITPQGHAVTSWEGNAPKHHMVATAAMLAHRINTVATSDD